MDTWLKDLVDRWNGWGLAVYCLIIFTFACILCGAVGLERERHGYAAGLRTHILVGLGSCVFTIVSEFAFANSDQSFDPGRIAAQVVPGIGFIGAGAILQNGLSIKGLTTAATLWISAAIGMATGAGLVIEAAIGTAFALTILILLKFFEGWRKGGKRTVRLAYVIPRGDMSLGKVTAILDRFGLNIKDVDIGTCYHDGTKCSKIVVTFQVKDMKQVNEVMDEIMKDIAPLAMENIK